MKKPFLAGLALAVALVALALALPSFRARLAERGAPSGPPEGAGAGSAPSARAAASPSPASSPEVLALPTPSPAPRALKSTGSPRLDAQIRKVVESMERTGRPPKGVGQGGRKGREPGVFQNLERRLPPQPTGYYREADVWPAKGTGGRGSERLVLGREGEVYYTKNHYRSFVRLR